MLACKFVPFSLFAVIINNVASVFVLFAYLEFIVQGLLLTGPVIHS